MYDDTLDFHNLGVIEPNQIKFYFENFIENSFLQRNIHLLIVTGKGQSSNSPQGMVKKIVTQLLKSNQHILKYKQAEEQYGGSGAFEVWLKD